MADESRVRVLQKREKLARILEELGGPRMPDNLRRMPLIRLSSEQLADVEGVIDLCLRAIKVQRGVG